MNINASHNDAVEVCVHTAQGWQSVYRVDRLDSPMRVTIAGSSIGRTGNATTETNEARTDWRVESPLLKGLYFLKYRCSIEYKKKTVALTALQYGILSLLSDSGGIERIDVVMAKCWDDGEPPDMSNFKATVCNLNARLADVYVPNAVRVCRGKIKFS